MQITIDKTAGSVTLTVNANELALLDCALGSFQSLADCPRVGHVGDHAAESDRELANVVEQQLFKAYCDVTEKDEVESLREFHADYDRSSNE